ncbi:MAG: phosphodiester glycosidase family protein [Cytophagaceae bacterium]|nr:phosphodiester glycosidase family protein [Cytophagaceae bacterium]
MNFDGGGSTTMYIKGQPENGVVNYPSDNKNLITKGSDRLAIFSISGDYPVKYFGGRIESQANFWFRVDIFSNISQKLDKNETNF